MSTVSASYGLTDSIDIGVAIPIVRTVVEGSAIFADISAAGTVRPGRTNPVPQLRGSSTGIGDFTVRAKVSFFKRGPTAVGLINDLRLGTGKEKRYNLLATNDLQDRIMLVASTERGRFSPHATAGYAFSKNLNDEFNYTAGTDIQVHDRVTLTGDLVGRHLRNNARCDGVAFGSAFCLPGTEDDPLNTFGIIDTGLQNRVTGIAPGFAEPGAFASEARLVEGSRNLLVGAIGTKIRVAGQFLAMATVLIQTNDTGFRPSPALVLGLEQSWGGR
ncbi:MAG: transporter [Acidobacteria bacterium]|nr:transporter [Acidobacteriota bacterium]